MKEELRLWSELEAHEAQAGKTNGEWLAKIEPAMALLHDLPNALTALPGFAAEAEHLNVAAMCLKRSLDDLRGMWLLLNAGYTSAAAAACADLWEHAMLASCASLSEEVAQIFLEDKPDDLRLGPSKLSAMLAELVAAGVQGTYQISPQRVASWNASDYAVYKWLCQIKHPTLRALQHTTRTTLNAEGVLGLTARPDASVDDQNVKGLLVGVAFGVITFATLLLGSSAIGDTPSSELDEWMTELHTGQSIVTEYLPPESLKAPWTIGDTKAGRRSRELSAETDSDRRDG